VTLRPRSAQILGVGIATLDLINEVERYPHEDAEVRALAQRRSRGGNAANTLEVLAQLGHGCRWSGTLANDAGADFIRADLAGCGIDPHHGLTAYNGATPTSYITLSRANGSRTIVHYRDLPELSARQFARIPLDDLDWIHFEGRNPSETAIMLRRARRDAVRARLSVELEKDRPGIDALLDGPDLILVGRAFVCARAGEGVSPPAALVELARRTSAHLLVLAWGAEGAWFYDRTGTPQQIPAAAPIRIVDTLGAGDVLNAGVIDGLLHGLELGEAVRRAVTLAGIKCGRIGLAGLVEAARAAGLQ